MNRLHWRWVVLAICLVSFTLMGGQCTNKEERIAYDSGQAIADVATEVEDEIFDRTPVPSLTMAPTPSLTPSPTSTPITKVSYADDHYDVFYYSSNELVTDGVAELDMGTVIYQIDPSTGQAQVNVEFWQVDDLPTAVGPNPYWTLVVAGGPEGIPPIPDYGYFGMGEWHVWCYYNNGMPECGLALRDDNDFIDSEHTIHGEMDGHWMIIYLPDGYPRLGERVGVAVQDAYHVDTYGLKDASPIQPWPFITVP